MYYSCAPAMDKLQIAARLREGRKWRSHVAEVILLRSGTR